MKGFLYGQTEYNMFNNTIHLDDYISLAKTNHFDFLTITDKNLYGHYKFYKACLSNNIKPIIGLEVSFLDDDSSFSTYLLYPSNNDGFKNLLKISTLINTSKATSLTDIKPYLTNIYVIVSLNDSILERLYSRGDFNVILNKLQEYQELNFYIGIPYTNNLANTKMYEYFDNKCKTNKLKVLPIHNARYQEFSDIDAYQSLRKIDNEDVIISDYEDYSFNPEPIINNELDTFINSINLDIYKETLSLPKYPNTNNQESHVFLANLALKGLNKRLGRIDEYYKQRLDYELSVIHNMKYDDYFLIVWDFIRYAKKNSILVGPGRGSSAGSLVAYCLGITEIDPIRYGLLFERFLNPERVTMPDIDIDFPDNKRDDVINYVKSVYGNDKICNISAYGTFLYKSSIRDLGKVKKLPQERIEELISLVGEIGFDEAITKYESREDIHSFLVTAKKLTNLPRHVSTHAAGIILSTRSLDEIIPLQTGINDLLQSQLEASDLEKIGLLKIDFLAIRNLTMIDEIVREITGEFNLNYLRNIPLNDRKTFTILQNKDTLGIFQLESQGISNVLYKLKPTTFEEIVAVLALYRPGPMDNIDEFIRRKNTNKFNYIHPLLEPILKETYGIIVYQEQIMQIARVFAGYSLGEADVLRRAVSKKDSSKLDELKNDFVTRSIKMGHEENIAVSIYELIYKFANYGFNKSHTVAYALISYWMAYLKANYFSVFMSNMLNYVISNTSTLVEYIKYSKARGLNILKPNINVSLTRFISTNVGVFMPFTVIFSIGLVVSKQIVEEREKNGLFKNYNDFVSRCPFLSNSNLEALIYSGALDIFGDNKKTMIENSDPKNSIFLKHLNDVISTVEEYDEAHLKEMELKYLGINIEYDLFKDYDLMLRRNHCYSLAKLLLDRNQNYLLLINKVKEIKTKNNETMAFLELSDDKLVLDGVVFPRDYNNLIIKPGKLYIVNGKGSYNKDKKLQLVVSNVIEYKS